MEICLIKAPKLNANDKNLSQTGKLKMLTLNTKLNYNLKSPERRQTAGKSLSRVLRAPSNLLFLTIPPIF